jgi:hypothetical protein
MNNALLVMFDDLGVLTLESEPVDSALVKQAVIIMLRPGFKDIQLMSKALILGSFNFQIAESHMKW